MIKTGLSRCRWKEEGKYEAHIFWDSDVAKWIEGVAYLLVHQGNSALEEIVDGVVEEFIQNQDEDGYFNSYYLVTRQDERFQNRTDHELYCAGHWMEAAVAYYRATGKDRFLKAVCRYADYIERVFKLERSAGFTTPGHPEVELALVKLYEVTNEKRYLDLSKFFIDKHGLHENDEKRYDFANELYNQDDMPLRDRSTAEGHSVRALYLLCGMVDIADRYADTALADACRRCFYNIVNKRMYITGGVGSTHLGEAFTIDYDLPNRTAYAETCAAISLTMFAGRMQKLEPNAIYGDTVERALYNGVLSGISMDGKSFFYENPLEIVPKFNNVNSSTTLKEHFPITQRVEVFDCSCCPPNIVRMIASVGDYLYTYDTDTLYIHQYIDSDADSAGMQIVQRTDYPSDGMVRIHCNIGQKTLALRIPSWCQKFTLNRPYELRNGFAYITVEDEEEITLHLEMPVVAMEANRQVQDDAGKLAVTRGPIVYCIEGVDNGEDLASVRLTADAVYELDEADFLLPSLRTKAYRPTKSEALYRPAAENDEEISLTLIPYFSFANRGETEMHVWILRK